MIDLSVVLISKNQAWNVSRLVESVLRATSYIHSREIILVDSASTDETVKVASRYPISIVCLRQGQRLSPAAGRFIGYKRTRGEFVLFLDGDMELLPGWLDQALHAMRAMPDAGAMLSSRMIELAPVEFGPSVPVPPKVTEMPAPTEVSRISFVVGGAALYRRETLEHVGTFNPYLYSEEEPELCLRIRHARYRILQLDFPIVRHYSASQETATALLSRRRRRFFLGVGQCIRYHMGDSLLWPYLKERAMWSFTAMLWLVAGLGVSLWSLTTRDYTWLGLWILATCLLIVSVSIRKRSLRRALRSVLNRFLMVEGLFKGFLIKPVHPDGYPCDLEIVKECKDLPVRRDCSGNRYSSTESFGQPQIV